MKKLTSIVLISLLVMSLATTTLSAADKPDEFKLGVLLPFTGIFSAVAETQKEGALLAVDEINQKGGLDMPWGKVKVDTIVKDDEADIKTGVRRFKYLKNQEVDAVVGQTWAPIAMAINELCKKDPLPYFPVNVAPRDSFKKGKLAKATYAAGYTPWTVGYMAASAAINELGKKKIYFLGRSDGWGWGIEEGVRSAVEEYGAEIVGKSEVAKGTSDFTSVLKKVKAANPGVFISAQFGGDAIALLKQSYDMGLYDEMTIFNSFMTNVVAKGLPAKVRDNTYAMHYFYYDMSNFEDVSDKTAKLAQEYTKRYRNKYGNPPDSYATIAYIATRQLFSAIEMAGSFKSEAINEVITKNPEFMSVKGPAKWRKDHEPIYENAGFLVKGKGPEEQSSEWDLFEIISTQGGEKVFPPLESLGY